MSAYSHMPDQYPKHTFFGDVKPKQVFVILFEVAQGCEQSHSKSRWGYGVSTGVGNSRGPGMGESFEQGLISYRSTHPDTGPDHERRAVNCLGLELSPYTVFCLSLTESQCTYLDL